MREDEREREEWQLSYKNKSVTLTAKKQLSALWALGDQLSSTWVIRLMLRGVTRFEGPYYSAPHNQYRHTSNYRRLSGLERPRNAMMELSMLLINFVQRETKAEGVGTVVLVVGGGQETQRLEKHKRPCGVRTKRNLFHAARQIICSYTEEWASRGEVSGDGVQRNPNCEKSKHDNTKQLVAYVSWKHNKLNNYLFLCQYNKIKN